VDEEMKKKISEETFFLSPDRLYIVLDPISVDKVTVRAYDTSDSEELSAAHILQQGMLSLLETDYDYLMQIGHEATLESISEHRSKEDNAKITVDEVYDNVIRVEFSKDN
jgi:hypothetical protein